MSEPHEGCLRAVQDAFYRVAHAYDGQDFARGFASAGEWIDQYRQAARATSAPSPAPEASGMPTKEQCDDFVRRLLVSGYTGSPGEPTTVHLTGRPLLRSYEAILTLLRRIAAGELVVHEKGAVCCDIADEREYRKLIAERDSALRRAEKAEGECTALAVEISNAHAALRRSREHIASTCRKGEATVKEITRVLPWATDPARQEQGEKSGDALAPDEENQT